MTVGCRGSLTSGRNILLFFVLSSLVIFAVQAQQLQEEEDTQVEEMRKQIKGWSKKKRECREIYAVESGSPVSYSSSNGHQYNHYQLDYTLHGATAWCSQSAQKGEWIQVSNQIPTWWTAIILQGRGDSSCWVTSFKVGYIVSGRDWTFLNDGQIFDGAVDRSTKRRIDFEKPIYARALRIFPITWHTCVCLRFDAIYVNPDVNNS